MNWARKDIELRRNSSTLAGLAWALYQAGEFAQALDTMNQALASGAADAHMFYQTALILESAGGNGNGEPYLQMAANLNPHYCSFHVHR